MTEEFESEAKRRGLKRVYMHARGSAVPFYERQGYEIFGEDFIEVGIPHKHMQKYLKLNDEPRIEEEKHTKFEKTKEFNSWLKKEFEEKLLES